MNLNGQQVVIIGGSSGIGLATAQLALNAGAKVAIAGRTQQRLDLAASSLVFEEDQLETFIADMSNAVSIESLFSNFAQVDHIFLPAGELRPDSVDIMKGDIEGIRTEMETRLLGIAQVVRNAKPLMSGGSIVLMSGSYAHRPAKGGAMAASVVAAVEGMTRALALDLSPIRVNAIAPGIVETPLWDAFGSQKDSILAIGAKLPVGRVGRPEEIAQAVLFLMTNGFVTGISLPIDGGGSLV